MYLRRVGDRVDFRRRVSFNEEGWQKCDTNSQIYLDYVAQNQNDNLVRERQDMRNNKINLKSRIIAGEALGIDMSQEIIKLDELMQLV